MGAEVLIDYAGYLINPDGSFGEMFDSSFDRGQPVTFQLGSGSIIPGLEQAIYQMNKGDRIEVDIPPMLAYGDEGVPDAGIGPNKWLRFIVDLIDYKV